MSTDGLGWAGRVMGWLRVGTDLIALNLLWLAGTVLGLVVLGAGPATAAAAPLLDGVLRGHPSDRTFRDFWHRYRAGWARANVLVAPVWVLLLLGVVDVAALRAASGPVATALGVGLGVVGLYAVAAAAFLVPVDERSDDRVPPTVRHSWKVALLAPALFPGTAAAVLVTLAGTVLLAWSWPVLVPLVGVSLPLALTGRLVRHRLEVVSGGAGADRTDRSQTGATAARRAGPL